MEHNTSSCTQGNQETDYRFVWTCGGKPQISQFFNILLIRFAVLRVYPVYKQTHFLKQPIACDFGSKTGPIPMGTVISTATADEGNPAATSAHDS